MKVTCFKTFHMLIKTELTVVLKLTMHKTV